jgi:tRNA nucleotidyltransferase (CCA-adding enzyme)
VQTGSSKRAKTIPANPEQSKHLETATMQLHGLSLDLVNLRSETYSVASRIPQIEFGTPLQDAERRDFTINALFYNLHTKEIEDFTGRGLQDLRDGIIRTPLAPLVTFLDGVSFIHLLHCCHTFLLQTVAQLMVVP